MIERRDGGGPYGRARLGGQIEAVVEERNKQMDTGKAIFVLWEYFDLLQKEGEDLRERNCSPSFWEGLAVES